MDTLVLQLPPRSDQHAFNLNRWEQLCQDTELARVESRIETNRHGEIIMMPPPGGNHGVRQFRIGALLESFLANGIAITECPISTSDGVKAADVGWFSRERLEPMLDEVAFKVAPEICVEVCSPSNTDAELKEKGQLYFGAGALEFWTCDQKGKVQFYLCENPIKAVEKSVLCPEFPEIVEIFPPGS